jgi:hypothetical protein
MSNCWNGAPATRPGGGGCCEDDVTACAGGGADALLNHKIKNIKIYAGVQKVSCTFAALLWSRR